MSWCFVVVSSLVAISEAHVSITTSNVWLHHHIRLLLRRASLPCQRDGLHGLAVRLVPQVLLLLLLWLLLLGRGLWEVWFVVKNDFVPASTNIHCIKWILQLLRFVILLWVIMVLGDGPRVIEVSWMTPWIYIWVNMVFNLSVFYTLVVRGLVLMTTNCFLALVSDALRHLFVVLMEARVLRRRCRFVSCASGEAFFVEWIIALAMAQLLWHRLLLTHVVMWW